MSDVQRPKAGLLRFARRREAHLVILLVLLVVVASLASPYFLTVDNIFNLNSGLVEKAMVALPLALIIISGEIDISVESMIGLSGAVFGQLVSIGLPPGLAVVVALVVGALGGLFNAVLVTVIGLPSLVVTLGTYALYRGAAYVILGPTAVSTFPAAFIAITQGYIPDTPIPLTFIALGVIVLAIAFAVHITPFGRRLFFLGRNSEAARLGGVRVARIKSLLFVIAGTVAALAGIVLTGRLSSARADNGQGFVLDILTAVLLGGVAITGGEGTIFGVLLALAGIGVLENVLTLANVDPHIQTTAVGLLLVVSVAAPRAERMLRERFQRRRAAVSP